jgi:hypothetical protein
MTKGIVSKSPDDTTRWAGIVESSEADPIATNRLQNWFSSRSAAFWNEKYSLSPAPNGPGTSRFAGAEAFGPERKVGGLNRAIVAPVRLR